MLTKLISLKKKLNKKFTFKNIIYRLFLIHFIVNETTNKITHVDCKVYIGLHYIVKKLKYRT